MTKKFGLKLENWPLRNLTKAYRSYPKLSKVMQSLPIFPKYPMKSVKVRVLQAKKTNIKDKKSTAAYQKWETLPFSTICIPLVKQPLRQWAKSR